jgi:transcription initiation factor TFIIIB Brf1 subunit/transcription initiation factor TFIIB
MPYPEDMCAHINSVIDEREGSIVCTSCGLVLDEKIFNFNNSNLSYQEDGQNVCFKNEVKEILSKLQLPEVYTNRILENFKNEISQKRNKKELLPYVIYKTLNENGIPISIKDISSTSGFTDISIYDMQESNKSLIVQPEDLLEKYCSYLGFDYKTYTLVKKLLPQQNISGHNPLTIIAATIYKYCKLNNIKISMKKISLTVKISCVSIQRYLKNNDKKR